MTATPPILRHKSGEDDDLHFSAKIFASTPSPLSSISGAGCPHRNGSATKNGLERVVQHPLAMEDGHQHNVSLNHHRQSAIETPENDRLKLAMNTNPHEIGRGPSRKNIRVQISPIINAADLIQSAARSVLDDSKSPSTVEVSDDEDDEEYDEQAENETKDGGGFSRGHSRRSPANSSTSPTSPTLRSLQRKTIPALPDEQDRKRFLGCLAAVLASSYDYDVLSGDDEDLDMTEATRIESETYLYWNELDDEAPDTAKAKQNTMGSHTKGSSSFESESKVQITGSHCSDNAQQPESLFDGGVGSFEYSEVSYGVFDEETMGGPNSSPTPNYPKKYCHPHSRQKVDKQALSRNRHRRRRYDVLSGLLMKSAEYLMVENSQARAFLPMLAKLLVPTPSSPPSSDSNEAIRPPSLQQSSRTRRLSSGSNISANAEKLLFERIKFAKVDGFAHQSEDIVEREMNEIDHLPPFLESLTPGAGLRCLSLLLLQLLMFSDSGYDSRIRHAIKKLGVLVLVHDMESDPDDGFAFYSSSKSRIKNTIRRSKRRLRGASDDLVALATRKFESLEHRIASKLIQLAHEQELRSSSSRTTTGRRGNNNLILARAPRVYTSEQILRGMKIGGTAIVAGTLFAVTGGLAAPGIAAGLAVIAGGTAATAAATGLLSSTAAVTAIFGVGGGGLAAYKMQRRTVGLTEFEFQKETRPGSKGVKDAEVSEHEHDSGEGVEAELFSTICLSGWLRDDRDFQRPWGVTPTKPRIKDRVELLERFYSIHSPDHVHKSVKILASWRGEEKELWRLLRKKYGRDPDHLFPLNDGPRFRGALTHEQGEIVDKLFVELGFKPSPPKEETSCPTPFERIRLGLQNHLHRSSSTGPFLLEKIDNPSSDCVDSLHGPRSYDVSVANSFEDSSVVSSGLEAVQASSSTGSGGAQDELKERSKRPKHLSTVWDYQANYGGELYTVKWESGLLIELCDSVTDMALDVVSGGTAQILKHTALATLMSAIAWPYALVNAANMIDGTWTLAVERADEAGKELARSLLFSRAGHRPVILVGYSFGARTIYSCLKELAKYQEKWEEFRERHGCQSIPERKPMPASAAMEGSYDFYKQMREPASIVEDAILMGMPNHLSLSSWKACRQVVAGRLVNCFSQRDLILSLMFQFKRLGLKPVCGTCPVVVKGVENIDVSDLVSGHEDYCLVAGDILKRVRHGQPFRSRPTRAFAPDLDNASDHDTEIDRCDL